MDDVDFKTNMRVGRACLNLEIHESKIMRGVDSEMDIYFRQFG